MSAAIPVPEHCPLFVVVDQCDGLTIWRDINGRPFRTSQEAQAFADEANSARVWPDYRVFSLTEVARG